MAYARTQVVWALERLHGISTVAALVSRVKTFHALGIPTSLRRHIGTGTTFPYEAVDALELSIAFQLYGLGFTASDAARIVSAIAPALKAHMPVHGNLYLLANGRSEIGKIPWRVCLFPDVPPFDGFLTNIHGSVVLEIGETARNLGALLAQAPLVKRGRPCRARTINICTVGAGGTGALPS
jgi:hypothetical protein